MHTLISPARDKGVLNYKGLILLITSYMLKHITLLEPSQETYEVRIILIL